MPCTTLLAGKRATNDGSTMIARNDDGQFDVKKLIVVEPKDQPKKYKSVIGHLEIELPDNPLRYTACPNVEPSEGIWAAMGINELNVGMTATETITSNPRVIGADPLVVYKKAAGRKEKDIPGGIGEEDLVTIVLPYIRSAREGVLRLGSLLEKYGTYEKNGIAFNDSDEVWWLETIGGHHWIARKVDDEEVVIMPNQFGLDTFDFDDAYGKKESNLCSADLKEFIEKNHLNTGKGESFNPREAFGSHSDADHVYNTPRAWFMGRYLMPHTYNWDGPDADFTPESDDIPWSFVPEKKITIEDFKYLLSSYYQGTPYNPYQKAETAGKGIYRPIGISRTGVMAVLQIRGDKPEPIKAVEWICFGSNAFNAALPVYPNVKRMPDYLSKVSTDVSTENFYWANRIIGVLADSNFGLNIQNIERYQDAVACKGREIINSYDAKMTETGKYELADEANRALVDMAREEATSTINKLMMTASRQMKNGYSRADN